MQTLWLDWKSMLKSLLDHRNEAVQDPLSKSFARLRL